jgi:ADP-heptose:LPS heptosyltransferase
VAVPARVLVVRPDRIGDLLLTTPMFRALKLASPATHVGALVRRATGPLLVMNPDVDEVVPEEGQPLGALVERLRRGRWDAAVFAFGSPRTSFAAWRAGVPLRIGPASKWWSVLYGRRVLQRRSRSARHEADYNLELLEPLGIPFRRHATRLEVTVDEWGWAKQHLVNLGLPLGQPILALHPGSGNSAGRWPLAAFAALTDRLAGEGHHVLLIFGPGERELPAAMRGLLRTRPAVLLPGSVHLRQLAAVIARLHLFVSNSTGPLHMAVAMGVPTVSFYNLTPATTPLRWGPYAAGHEVLTPPAGAGPERLERVTVDEAHAACLRQLERRGLIEAWGEPVWRAGATGTGEPPAVAVRSGARLRVFDERS